MKLIKGTFYLAVLVAACVMTLGGTALAETLLAHYQFNEAVGTTNNLADTGVHGTHTLTQSETATLGQVVYDADRGSNVLSNPNGSSFVMAQGTVGSLDLPANSSITLAGWFKQESVDSTTNLYIYALMLGYNSSEPIVSIGFLTDGTIVSYIETDKGDIAGTTNLDQMDVYTAPGTLTLDPTTYAFDGWHHVAVTYDRSIDIATIYLDGVAQQTTSRENTTPTTTYANGSIAYLSDTDGFSFDTRTEAKTAPGSVSGYYGTDGSEFRGRLDDLRVYQGALTAAQIRDLVVPEPSLLALLAFGAMGLLLSRRQK